jgi:hypothetical protein
METDIVRAMIVLADAPPLIGGRSVLWVGLGVLE